MYIYFQILGLKVKNEFDFLKIKYHFHDTLHVIDGSSV